MIQSSSLLGFVSSLVLVVHVWREFALNSASTHWLSCVWAVFRHHHLPETHVPTSTRSQNRPLDTWTPARATIVSGLVWYTEVASCLHFSWLHGPKSKQCSCWKSFHQSSDMHSRMWTQHIPSFNTALCSSSFATIDLGLLLFQWVKHAFCSIQTGTNYCLLYLQHRDVVQLCLQLGSLSSDGGEISLSAPELCSSLVHYTLLRLK